jgi:hypothetical protein
MPDDLVDMGVVRVRVECPRCHRLEVALVILAPVLTITADREPSLKVKAKSNALDHSCEQSPLFDVNTG